ncbi:MAG: hypothetical protein WA867_01425, partial [Candidatus Acidiferrales bacterium]
KNSLLSSRKKPMRICFDNRRKGNSNGKRYLGSNQFLGCGIAGSVRVRRMRKKFGHENELRPRAERLATGRQLDGAGFQLHNPGIEAFRAPRTEFRKNHCTTSIGLPRNTALLRGFDRLR